MMMILRIHGQFESREAFICRALLTREYPIPTDTRRHKVPRLSYLHLYTEQKDDGSLVGSLALGVSLSNALLSRRTQWRRKKYVYLQQVRVWQCCFVLTGAPTHHTAGRLCILIWEGRYPSETGELKSRARVSKAELEFFRQSVESDTRAATPTLDSKQLRNRAGRLFEDRIRLAENCDGDAGHTGNLATLKWESAIQGSAIDKTSASELEACVNTMHPKPEVATNKKDTSDVIFKCELA